MPRLCLKEAGEQRVGVLADFSYVLEDSRTWLLLLEALTLFRIAWRSESPP